MRLSSLGNGLVIAGGALGVASVTAIATGTELVLSPAMIQLLIYKGLAAAAVGLIVVGSWLGRRGRQQERTGKGAYAGMAELESGSPPFHRSVTTANEPATIKVSDAPSN